MNSQGCRVSVVRDTSGNVVASSNCNSHPCKPNSAFGHPAEWCEKCGKQF